MALVTTIGPNGTAVDGVTAIDLPLPPLNFDEDFVLLSDDPGNSVYTDITSPIDQPATLRIATRDVANCYAGTSIDPASFLASRKGRDIVVQVREVVKITDSDDATYAKLFPISAGLTMSVPMDALVTAYITETLIGRLVAALAAMGEVEINGGTVALLRGVTRK